MNKTKLLQQVMEKVAKNDLEDQLAMLSDSQRDCLDDLKINVKGIAGGLGNVEVKCDLNSWKADQLKRLLKEKSFITMYASQQGTTLIFEAK